MKILLVQTPNAKGRFLNLPGKEIPLALCCLAAYLKQHDFADVRILDLDWRGAIAPFLEEELRRYRPDLVGITSYTANIGLAGEVAGQVKNFRSETATVIGGLHASALPGETLHEFQHFDYLAFGEGEMTLLELSRALESGTSPKGLAGLAWRENGGRVELGPPRPFIDNLDALPFPDRSLVPVTKYRPDPGNYFQLPSTGILFSRGCPFSCAYCSKAVFQQRLRYRGVENFIEEIEECCHKFGIRDFRLEDDGPTANPRKIGELCERLLVRERPITWNCFSRVDKVDPPLLRLMRRAGCYHVTYGVESANEQTLKRIHKEIDLDRARQAVQWTRREGIECKVNFIFGFPWETLADFNNTVRYACALNPDLVSFNIFKPLPGSLLYNSMIKEGAIHHRSWEDYFVTSDTLFFDASFTEQDLRQLIQWAFLRFYFRPVYIARRFLRLLRYPRREIRTIADGLKILGKELWQQLRRKSIAA